MRSTRFLSPIGLALAATIATAGCLSSGGGGGAMGGPGPMFCVAGVFPDADAGGPAAGATFTVVVGSEDATKKHVATVWRDGNHVPLIAGGQGGFMIRPSLDVTTPAPLPEDGAGTTCLGVRMIAAAPANAGPVVTGAQAPRIAGTSSTYHVAPLFGLLTYSSEVGGASIPVIFDILAPGGSGRTQVTVVPDATLSL